MFGFGVLFVCWLVYFLFFLLTHFHLYWWKINQRILQGKTWAMQMKLYTIFFIFKSMFYGSNACVVYVFLFSPANSEILLYIKNTALLLIGIYTKLFEYLCCGVGGLWNHYSLNWLLPFHPFISCSLVMFF